MVKVLILDVDGTLTDGNITYTNGLDELKSFNVKDGLAIRTWIKMGRKVAFITGKESKIVKTRAKTLGVHYLYQLEDSKLKRAKSIAKKEAISLQEMAFVGDDLNDFALLKKLKYSYMPKDGAKELRDVVYKVLKKRGGKGAVREAIYDILKKENLIEEFLKVYM